MKIVAALVFGGVLMSSWGALAFPTSAASAGSHYYNTGAPAPAQFMVASNVIKDYHHYHLDKPLDGYEWVHGTENDYLLVSTKTSIIRRIENRPYISPEK